MRFAQSTVCLATLMMLRGAAQTQPPLVRTTTAGVVIDVSVLDQKGQPVVDLRPEDFEVSEDGKRQQVLTVRLVQNGTARAQATNASAAVTAALTPPPAPSADPGAPMDGGRMPSVTAIVFDSLTPEARPLAHRAASAYAATLSPPADYAGVFLTDLGMRTVQSFTSRPESIRVGLDRLAGIALANTAPVSVSESPRIQGLDSNQPPTAGAESGGGFVSPLDREKRLTGAGGQDPSEVLLTRMELRMRETYLQFLSELEGQSSLAGLAAVVRAFGVLPGRKSILYFTENLPITSRLKTKFDALIGEANRANITVYAVDAAGLRVHSKEAEVGRNVNLAGTQGVGDASRGDGPYTKELERQEQILSSRPAAALGRLAKETGGFLLENTNDLAAGVARMQQERTTYYLLGYQPTNTSMDGKFRKVTVKVKRPKVTVRARPGYVAAAAQR
jgi:VWFA-related protein